MEIDAKEILKRFQKEDKIRRSIYVSETVYNEFQKACGKATINNVIEELMRQFAESVKNEKPRK